MNLKESIQINLWLQQVALEEVRELQKEGVKTALSGDGRYDSPGNQIGSFILSDVIEYSRIQCIFLYVLYPELSNKESGVFMGSK